MKIIKLWLLRHGECEGGQILRGKVDVALSDAGQAQMSRAASRIEPSVDRVFSSSLQRCANWSQGYAKEKSLECQLVEGLEEIDFGVWDGQSFEQLYQDYDEQMQAYWCDPWDEQHTPENGESLLSFQQRVLLALEPVINEVAQIEPDTNISANMSSNTHVNHSGETEAFVPSALIVTHGGVIKALLAHVLSTGQTASMFSHFKLPYAALLSLDVYVEGDDIDNCQFCLNWPEI
ncbi:histidine phosphatase family protein [Shewanella sp. WXL01]|uniref:histidine phosphatase family protein n=1 Tax=Shewanella sp. WXL01 TaxID=2709721 RepID=UPI0014386722|nr:histidine phosphatase family protein [Shewanella sp. WXL01]NKF50895.1 histidine phosphatase family protein [Shewanella sp. WXL01]